MKKRLSLLLALALCVSLLAGCGGTQAAAPAAAAPAAPAQSETAPAAPAAEPAAAPESTDGYAIEVLNYRSEGDFGGPNPFRHSTRGPGSTKMAHVFDSLLQAGTKDWIPWLAEEWSLSDDGLKYSFKLHEDALWHDGQPVTADDVAFTIDYYGKYPNSNGNLGTADASIIDHYEVTGEHSIDIYVKQATITNTSNVGSFPIIPRHIWENVDDPYNYDGDDKYVGCGMYKFVSYDNATGAYQFEAFEDYYGYHAAAHYLNYFMVSDTILAFENGDIAITDVSADLFDMYAARDDIAMIPKNDEMGFRLMLNMDRVPAFRDVEVRAALYKALDRQAMVDSMFQGLGHIASAGYVPQTNKEYNDAVVKYDYDPDAAKAVLEPLGLNVRLVIGQDTPNEGTLGERLKLDLEAAGLTVNVESYDVATRDAMSADGDYDLLLTYHGGWNAEPVSMLKAIYGAPAGSGSKWAPHGYENPELTALINSIPTTIDPTELREKYDQAQLLISQEIPQLPLITQVSYAMYRPAEYACWKASFNSTQFSNSRLSYTVNDPAL